MDTEGQWELPQQVRYGLLESAEGPHARQDDGESGGMIDTGAGDADDDTDYVGVGGRNDAACAKVTEEEWMFARKREEAGI